VAQLEEIIAPIGLDHVPGDILEHTSFSLERSRRELVGRRVDKVDVARRGFDERLDLIGHGGGRIHSHSRRLTSLRPKHPNLELLDGLLGTRVVVPDPEAHRNVLEGRIRGTVVPRHQAHALPAVTGLASDKLGNPRPDGLEVLGTPTASFALSEPHEAQPSRASGTILESVHEDLTDLALETIFGAGIDDVLAQASLGTAQGVARLVEHLLELTQLAFPHRNATHAPTVGLALRERHIVRSHFCPSLPFGIKCLERIKP